MEELKMNLAFALNSYNQAKVAKDLQKGDGYAAVKFARTSNSEYGKTQFWSS